MMAPRQPGWYDDPDDPNGQRYWDGQAWTPHRQRRATFTKDAGAAPGGGWGDSSAPMQDADYPRKRSPWWLVILCLIAALLLLLLFFGFFSLGNKIFRGRPSASGPAGPGTSAPTTLGAPGTSAAAAPPGSNSHTPGSVRVIIDGQEKSVPGTLSCLPNKDGTFYIGTDKLFDNFAVVLRPGTPLVVDSVAFPQGPPSNPAGGLAGLGMLFNAHGPAPGEASAVKDGNSYTIKGTAADAASAYTTTRPFEIDATCPS